MSTREAHPTPLPARGRISRREFVRRAGAVAASVTLLALGSRLALSRSLPEIPGERLMRSTFAGHLDAAFAVAPEGGSTTPLRLADVADLPGAAATDAQREHSFALRFRGAVDQPLSQGIYRFQHPGIGAFAVFIVPEAPAADARYYEAVFNRLPV